MDTINVGTIETVSVYFTDRLGTITAIPAADCKVVSEDESAIVQNWGAVEHIEGMRVDCLLNTTTGAGVGGLNQWPEGTYKLYVRVNLAPEFPVEGPWEFGVS